ncbi:MAG TPA: glycoside hydrolase family 32 protein [Puia sp.]|jgi:levanase/fructan beta-fructosidase
MKQILFSVGLLGLWGFVSAQSGEAPAEALTPQWRPVYHFTPEKNWTNDPNGPIYLKGEYLLYNQQNPYENKWGHMSWGHARSKDLLRWEHLPVAIPEKIDRAKGDTVWIFSGSAVWDKNNTSGFCRNGGCLVAIYTAHQPNLKKESQYIAYSNDGGMSYTNYSGNPVIDLQKHDFRDPNVFWHTGSKQWVMTVAIPAEHKVHFYGSPDLKNWTLLSEFGPQGYVSAYWECPSLIELPVKGGGTRWVLMNSAAGGQRGVFMQYYVGTFDGKTFVNDNASDTVLTVDYGDCFYAAIPWNNMPDDAKVLIGWMVPGKEKTAPWTGQMSISRDMSLKKTAEGYRLIQEPAAIVRKGLPRSVEMKDIAVSGGEVAVNVLGNAYWLDAEMDLGAAATAGFKIAQGKDASGKVVSETVIGYDKVKQEVFVDRSRSSRDGVKPEKVRQTIALSGDAALAAGKVRLRILFDKSSLEVFVNDGEEVLTDYIYPDEAASGCAVFAEGGNAVVRDLKIWDLSKL